MRILATLPATGLVALLLCAAERPLRADSGSVDEYEVKAAMLYNLTRFVEWPATKLGGSKSPLTMCVLGPDSLARDLTKVLSGKTSGTHPIEVRRSAGGGPAPEGCHVLMVAQGERKRLLEWAPTLARDTVLTVGDGEKFAASGSVIGLVLRDNRVQIEVNLAAAQRSGLVVSSRLLRLATVVREGD